MLLITNGMMWTPYDWLNKFYSVYVVAVVGIISRRGLSIDEHHKNHLNKYTLALYKPSIHFNSSLKWLYISSKTEYFNYRGECSAIRIEAFKKELVWLHISALRYISII